MPLRRTPVAALAGLVALTGMTGIAGCNAHPTAPVAVAAATLPSAAAPTILSAAPSAAAPAAAGHGSILSGATGLFAGSDAASAVPNRPDRSRVGEAPTTARTVHSVHSLTGLTIVLDPGHNGANAADPRRLNSPVPAGGFTKACNTAGAETNAGYPEHAFNWDVVNRAAALLRAAGAKVVLTRHSDTGFGPCVNDRAAVGNSVHADAVVAVHADGAASGAYGFHVIAPALAPDHGNAAMLARSWALAQAVHSAFHSVAGEPFSTYVSGGLTRRSDLAGLNLSRVPTIFIECANMRNSGDAGRVSSAAWRQKAAAGIVAGITAFLHR
jgi:N-acetylmuramoyl-L-alanine amidase